MRHKKNTILPTLEEFKDQARELRESIKSIKNHTTALNELSKAFGYRNFGEIKPHLISLEENEHAIKIKATISELVDLLDIFSNTAGESSDNPHHDLLEIFKIIEETVPTENLNVDKAVSVYKNFRKITQGILKKSREDEYKEIIEAIMGESLQSLTEKFEDTGLNLAMAVNELMPEGDIEKEMKKVLDGIDFDKEDLEVNIWEENFPAQAFIDTVGYIISEVIEDKKYADKMDSMERLKNITLSNPYDYPMYHDFEEQDEFLDEDLQLVEGVYDEVKKLFLDVFPKGNEDKSLYSHVRGVYQKIKGR